MPLYEYECLSCGDHFECRQRMVDEPIKTCPSCEGEVRRVLFPVGIIFKGPGFYVTDSRSKQPIGGHDNGNHGKSRESSESSKSSSSSDTSATKPGSSDSSTPSAEKATAGSKH